MGFSINCGYDFNMIDSSTVIDDFTGGTPRASEWKAMRQALADRQRGLRLQLETETDPAQIASLERQIAAMEKQIETLQTEEVVAKFVEKSIEAALARAPGDLLVGEEDEDYK